VNEYLKLDNRAKVVKGSRNSLTVSREQSSDKKSEVISIRGELGVDSGEVVVYKSILDPALWAGWHLKEFLRQRGISFTGVVRSGKTPGTAKVLAQVKSKPIAAHVSDMMKFSNNYVAEILTKNLGVHVYGPPGTMDKGVGQLKEYLKGLGITDFEITSPSGLSRRNEMRAQDLFKVLSHLKSNFRVFPEYLSSMPIMGVDGTLKRRMGSSSALAQVRAKTGHLTGVNGLAGYLGKADEKQLTFVFLYNGSASEAAKAKELFDDIILKLLE
jgi:serine-type D-Ala-D-Ala carboxypeptidase/endopeptidase (penicillin-binding protein 4)